MVASQIMQARQVKTAPNKAVMAVGMTIIVQSYIVLRVKMWPTLMTGVSLAVVVRGSKDERNAPVSTQAIVLLYLLTPIKIKNY